MRARAGTHFDPDLVQLFLANVEAEEQGKIKN